MGLLGRIANKFAKNISEEKIIVQPEVHKRHQVVSYAQEGEDIILKRIFNNTPKGFFVDIGAHHPFRFSNTFLFYQNGWRGINIDPIPGIKNIFDESRPEDINLEIGVGLERKEMVYYNFKEKALNTFSESVSTHYQNHNRELESKINIEVFPLAEILDNYVPAGMKIDFMSMDIEGLEFDALSSNNWEKYKPKCLLVEILDMTLEKVVETDIYKLLDRNGYFIFAKTFNTFFFLQR